MPEGIATESAEKDAALDADPKTTIHTIPAQTDAVTISAPAMIPMFSRRLENTTVCFPIVHGSVAFYMGKKADEFQSHQWTLYLRGPRNENISHCIQKVVFTLHASFAQPVREYTQPPFEVTEKGWGEFEAHIRIHWKDPGEDTTLITHGIKLHPPGAPTTISAAADTTTPVVSEVYDEVVFTDPNENFFQQLQDVRNVLSIETEYSQHKHFTQFSDTNDTLALLEAQNFVQRQLSEAKERLKLVDDDLEQVENNLIVAREQQQQQRAAAAAAAVAPANAKNNNSNANRLPSHKTSGKSKTSIDSGNTSTANDGAVAKGPPSKKVKQK